jgi:hypothetical protein
MSQVVALCAHDPAATFEKPTERSGLGGQSRSRPIAETNSSTAARMSSVAPTHGSWSTPGSSSPRDLLSEIPPVIRREPRVRCGSRRDTAPARPRGDHGRRGRCRARPAAKPSIESTPASYTCAGEPHAPFDAAAGGNRGQPANPCGTGASRRPYRRRRPHPPSSSRQRQDRGACSASASGSPPDGWSGARCGRGPVATWHRVDAAPRKD